MTMRPATKYTVHAPAKINLFLHITGRRADGYHNLQTVFRRISLYDTLTFTPTSQPIADKLPVNLINAETVTAQSTDNLIVKASLALLDFVKKTASDFNINHLPIIDIALDKKIPMGAGLGGGSSDCATTLITLNQLWQLGLSNAQLQAIGATLGADVPIFIFGKDAIGEGIGEILTPIELPPQRFLLLKPNAHINTKVLFGNAKLQRNCPSFSHDFLQGHSEQFTDNLSNDFSNVFEPVVIDLSKDIKQAFDFLQAIAKITNTTPRLTGSGSCVFLPVGDNITDSQLSAWQQQSPCPTYVVKSLD